MFINVQFKNAKKEFVGKEYSYELCPEEEAPKPNTIARLMDENYNYLNYGTRIRINSCTKEPLGKVAGYIKARYIETSLED